MKHLKLFENVYSSSSNDTIKHNILYISGMAHLLTKDAALDISEKSSSVINILSKYGDNISYPILNWKSNDKKFDMMDEIIINKKIDIIVGFSAGGYISFFLSNKYKIPTLSINPAMARTSKAPIIQPMPVEYKKSSINPNQIVLIGELDSLDRGGVDGIFVVEDLQKNGFEERGGEILYLSDTYHKLKEEKFDKIFSYFYKKLIK